MRSVRGTTGLSQGNNLWAQQGLKAKPGIPGGLNDEPSSSQNEATSDDDEDLSGPEADDESVPGEPDETELQSLFIEATRAGRWAVANEVASQLAERRAGRLGPGIVDLGLIARARGAST